jgi:hypothetical protein
MIMSAGVEQKRIPKQVGVYERQLTAFREKFGREMGPDDPFFFDSEAERPEFQDAANADQALEILAEMLTEAGADQEQIYAFRKTGGLFPDARNPFTRWQQLEWDSAVNEYREQRR